MEGKRASTFKIGPTSNVLSLSSTKPEIKGWFKDDELDQAVDDAGRYFVDMLSAYNDPSQPYIAGPLTPNNNKRDYDVYRHLKRLGEVGL